MISRRPLLDLLVQNIRTEDTLLDGMGSRTLALTLSKEGGLTMEKQIRKTSVWG